MGQTLAHVRLGNPFLLRTLEPPLSSVEGRAVCGLRRVGKRIAIGVEGELWLVLHLMIAGRLHWRPPRRQTGRPAESGGFRFRARLAHPDRGRDASAARRCMWCTARKRCASLDPGGIDVLAAGLAAFREALIFENHTLKRALTDPRTFSGIGNAYSDEILHAARLSPIAQTRKLDGGRDRSPVCRDTRVRWRPWMRPAARRGAPEISRKSDRFPRRHGRARALRPTLPALRRARAAHPLRRQRNELLRTLPD